MDRFLPAMIRLITQRIGQCVVGCSLVLLGSSCDLNTYALTAEKLRNPRNPSHAFIHNESHIRGIYGNMDVDAAIYCYQTTAGSVSDFWAAIENAANKDGWAVIDDTDLPAERRRFLRITPKTGQQILHGVEETRISFNPDSQSVIVAWVQSDQRKLPPRFPTDGPEGNFAKTVVWPRFETEAGKPNGR